MTKIKDFTPVLDSITHSHDLLASVVYGRIWRYEQGKEKMCVAARQTIANNLGISEKTVERRIALLLKEKYIKDLTPGLRYKPHNYITTGKAGISLAAEAYDEVRQRVGLGTSESRPELDLESVKDTKNKQSQDIKDILSMWETLFPNKRQPKPTTLKSKIAARMRNPLFRENWERTMRKAAKSPHLQSEGWFQLEYFVRNNEKFQKIMDGAFDSFDRQVKQNGTIPDASNYTADLETRRVKARKKLMEAQV